MHGSKTARAAVVLGAIAALGLGMAPVASALPVDCPADRFCVWEGIRMQGKRHVVSPFHIDKLDNHLGAIGSTWNTTGNRDLCLYIDGNRPEHVRNTWNPGRGEYIFVQGPYHISQFWFGTC